MKTILIISLFALKVVLPQNLKYITEFGKFNSAISFTSDLNSNFYIIDQQENTIYKLDSLGEEIVNIGGYGWEESTFDNPVNIFTNTLSIYVADKNNNRIQRFDKDLNFLSQYDGSAEDSEIQFGYPTCVAISNIGDLFILDSDNNRILKYNLTGEFLQEIGGNDAGVLAINNPQNFTIDNSGNIYVLDNDKIKIFDQYGNGQFKFSPLTNIKRIKFINNKLWLLKKRSLVKFDMKERNIAAIYNDLPNIFEEEIIDIDLSEKFLFVLTHHRIIKYKILN